MRQVRFTLRIPAEEMLRYYRGRAASVSVIAEDGRRLRFPAETLRPFVSREGINGRFVLRFDERNRLQGLERID